ncbi:Asp23/Gls24 family envelope stress response protein [Liquorilactobacillus satsumensis]|uniref:Alkaline shock protein n=1 Tax=Liquorilactobacillus satsumensis DSM 16230 = JCM 12392 TaxID=1423801 RepID=A0A0R1UXQ7_9LACO|nr:Asp23/Gls24 family envelope stress response protein [Liquorilactobacillus satsumensis]KRL98061.1 alkaline shock protein [Liquorilactobacillus satsumensis DSM 16230 = JCM 12392]MCC7665866.1 Asp23/Gls24 family envelope stress response protein [Liquorilactobacillus satsumensis]MCP9312174.1 Asp23/Gls24 family envelope stress response protein [Liquorilactobacillus satsumensis]MCP9356573.1 Asp23/Gls24 family envelope stress response protein [Liquorilactobacillus satsumensis]MCP9359452.1 Asp23/Gls
MAENNNILIETEKPRLGQIEIAPEVIEIIIGIATSQVKGVYSMRGSLASSLNELFGRKSRGKGVRLEQEDKALKVEVYVFLNYGVSVPKVALEIQEKVKQQLFFMTGLKLTGVDVFVQGVVPAKQVSTIDPNNLFNEKENGDNK